MTTKTKGKTETKTRMRAKTKMLSFAFAVGNKCFQFALVCHLVALFPIA